MKKNILIVAIILAVAFVSFYFGLHKGFSQKANVRDLSSINLPSYTLKNTSLTKDNVIKEITENIKSDPLLKHGQKPKMIQCIIIPYDVYTNLILNNEGGSNLIPKDKLFFLVVVDIERSISETMIRGGFFQGNTDLLIYKQEYFLIDPETNETVEHGYFITRIILPKQN